MRNRERCFKDHAFDMLQEPSTSHWCRKAILDLSGRDVVDVINDLAALKSLFEMKYQEMFKHVTRK